MPDKNCIEDQVLEHKTQDGTAVDCYVARVIDKLLASAEQLRLVQSSCDWFRVRSRDLSKLPDGDMRPSVYCKRFRLY